MGSPDDARPLFRPEAANARRRDTLGSIVIVRPVSFTCLTAAASAIAGVVVAFLIWGTYTQHSTLPGRLVPDLGVIKVFAPQPGTLVEKHVVEGAAVERGDVLYVVSSERFNGELGATHERIGAELERRRSSLAAQIEHTRALERTERESLLKMRTALQAEAANLRDMLAGQRERLTLAEQAAARYARIRVRGFASEEQLSARREASIEQKSRLQGLERERSNVDGQLADLESRLEGLPLEYDNRLAELERALAATRQELAENDVRRRVAVTAPATGIATTVVGMLGQLADTGRPLASIVPAGATLRAELYAPSRAIGFVAPGDTALLRYQAYPYQKFGHHRAIVESISLTAAPAAEIAGTAPGRAAATEPVYRITLELPAQTLDAYGRTYALQTGMAVEADVLLETRRLYEWMLEPLYSLTAKLH